MPIIFDSGVRSGSDIFKAIALDATGVAIGRPFMYGLALAGQEGVEHVIKSILADFARTMALSGCETLADIDRSRLDDSHRVARL